MSAGVAPRGYRARPAGGDPTRQVGQTAPAPPRHRGAASQHQRRTQWQIRKADKPRLDISTRLR